MSAHADIVIRRATEGDLAALRRLAELDSAGPPTGPYLLLEEGGELRAALSLDHGRPLADPFHATEDLVVMLQLRAASARSGREAPMPGGLAVRSAAWLRRTLAARPLGGAPLTDRGA
jgi:hypothetical protein